MRIGLQGHGRHGKDDAAELLVKEFGFRFAGSTSVVISHEVARREGITFPEAHAQRHARRDHWYKVGNELRKDDPAYLVKQLLPHADIIVGVRDREEMEASRQYLDINYWVDRKGWPKDPTLKFGEEMCDVIVPNWWGLEEYKNRWRKIGELLARSL